MSLIDAIKDRVDLPAYVKDDLGNPIEKNVACWMFYCPFHKDDSPSFAVYSDGHYHCFGCSRHGDIIDYVAERLGKTKKESIEFLAENNSIETFAKRPERKPEVKTVERVDLPMEEQYERHANVSRVLPYLHQRGITDEIIERNLIGAVAYKRTYVDTTGRKWDFSCNRVALPYILDGKVYSLNYRRDDLSAMQTLERMSAFHKMDMFEFMRIDIAEKENRDPADIKREKVMRFAFGNRFYRPNTPITVYGVHNVARRDGEKMVYMRRPYAIITEGEFNQLSAEVDRFYCIAGKQIAGVDLPRLLQNVRMILIAVDPGEGGEIYANKIMDAFHWDNTRVRKIEMPTGFDDMNIMKQQGILKEFLQSKPYYLDQF